MATSSDWMEDAACRNANTDLFYPNVGSKKIGYRNRRAAMEYCEACPVMEQCLDYAIKEKIEDGIWGGVLPRQRKMAIIQRRSRGL